MGAAFAFTSVNDTQDVLVVRNDVKRGETIDVGDLAVVRVSVDPALASVPGSQKAQLEGSRAAVDLWAGSLLTEHAVNVALHDNGRDRVNDARESGRRVHLAQHRSPYAVAPTGAWLDRMTACENTAHSYLSDRFAESLAGEAIRPVEDPSRLAQALANWEIQSHRALARQLEPSNILLITRTQGLIAGASMVLVGAAATAGILEPSDRLVPAIADAGRSWSDLASRWGDLAPPGARIQEPLSRAAAEVRAAYRQITHDPATLASSAVIAGRPGLPQAVTATLRAVEASSELAHVVAEKADNRDLTGSARTLSRRAHNDIDSGLVPAPPEGDLVWVSPVDILARRWVPLPKPVATALRAVSATAATASSAASREASLHLLPAPVGGIPSVPGRGSDSRTNAGWRPLGAKQSRGVTL